MATLKFDETIRCTSGQCKNWVTDETNSTYCKECRTKEAYNLGCRVKAARLAQGLTISEVVRRMNLIGYNGLYEAKLHQLEDGLLEGPQGRLLEALEAFFGCTKFRD